MLALPQHMALRPPVGLCALPLESAELGGFHSLDSLTLHQLPHAHYHCSAYQSVLTYINIGIVKADATLDMRGYGGIVKV